MNVVRESDLTYCVHGAVFFGGDMEITNTVKERTGRGLPGALNPAWRGGPVRDECLQCGTEVLRRRSCSKSRPFCSRRCQGAYFTANGLWNEAQRAAWADPVKRAAKLAGIRAARARIVSERRVTWTCLWPGCTTDVTQARSQVNKLKLCAEHRAAIKNVTGFKKLNGVGIVISNLDRVYASRTVPTGMRAVLFLSYGGRCGHCNDPLVFVEHGTAWEVDHIVPVFEGGLTTRKNLMPLCRSCHVEKTAPEIKKIRRLMPNASPLRHRWKTHAEKDALIASLRAENRRLTELMRTMETER